MRALDRIFVNEKEVKEIWVWIIQQHAGSGREKGGKEIERKNRT